MNYQNFSECISQEFKTRPAPPHLVQALFARFKPFKMHEDKIELGAEMDIIDFSLAVLLLSRIPVDNKIKSKSPVRSNLSSDV